MGTWTYWHGNYRPLKNKEIKEEIINREFSGCKIHAISIPKWGEAYVAFSNDRLTDPNAIHCAVVKIVCNTSTEIGFKVMDESMGPFYYNCPKKILKMLSPTEYENAIEWREECWKNFKRRT